MNAYQIVGKTYPLELDGRKHLHVVGQVLLEPQIIYGNPIEMEYISVKGIKQVARFIKIKENTYVEAKSTSPFNNAYKIVGKTFPLSLDGRKHLHVSGQALLEPETIYGNPIVLNYVSVKGLHEKGDFIKIKENTYVEAKSTNPIPNEMKSNVDGGVGGGSKIGMVSVSMVVGGLGLGLLGAYFLKNPKMGKVGFVMTIAGLSIAVGGFAVSAFAKSGEQ